MKISTQDELKLFFINHSLRIAVAESLTCGSIQKLIGEISGASKFFEGGITAYSIDQKVNLLNVCRIEAENTNCVSQKIAEQMAVGVSNLFNVDASISTTGYAEPDFSNDIHQPFCHISVYLFNKTYHKQLDMPGKNRIEAQACAAENAILFLLDCAKKHIS